MRPSTFFGLLAVGMIAFGLVGCASVSEAVKPYADAVKNSQFGKTVARYHEGTPCSSFRYADLDCD
ncbi:MAG TPA: hypothetical protein VKA19_07230 [Alphaproteobacteria bacterium]|nr:hypothetical protein [Alphaproteobacteria bacterium]